MSYSYRSTIVDRAHPRPVIHVVLTLLAIMIVACAVSAKADQTARVYPATPGEPVSGDFHVTVNGLSSPVYMAKVGTPIPPAMVDEKLGRTHFTSFDMNGEVTVTVTYSHDINEVKLLPTARGIDYSISGKQVTFSFLHRGQLTLEVNGDWQNSLHLFANSFETDIPSPNDPNVIYYAPGIHHLNSTVNVGSGQTVYLAAGAVLYAGASVTGPLFSLFGSNITFRGRGIKGRLVLPR